MNKRRLLKLADLLEADAKNEKGIQFDIGTWGETNTAKVGMNCGTKACAMGLAALSGAFKRAGLTFKTHRYGDVLEIDVMCKGDFGLGAASNLFDIEYSEAETLFTPSAYPGRETGTVGELAVAARIREFVAGKLAP